MKTILFILFVLLSMQQLFAQVFDGKFINPKSDSLLLIIEPEQVIQLDTFGTGEFNHYGNSPYVGLLKLTSNVTGLYRFKSGQYYTKYVENGKEKTRWLGWINRTGATQYLGNTVMRDNRGTQLWYLQLDEKGLPYRVMLPEWAQPKTE